MSITPARRCVFRFTLGGREGAPKLLQSVYCSKTVPLATVGARLVPPPLPAHVLHYMPFTLTTHLNAGQPYMLLQRIARPLLRAPNCISPGRLLDF
eukprot:3775984-Amphidinium_carterae.1